MGRDGTHRRDGREHFPVLTNVCFEARDPGVEHAESLLEAGAISASCAPKGLFDAVTPSGCRRKLIREFAPPLPKGRDVLHGEYAGRHDLTGRLGKDSRWCGWGGYLVGSSVCHATTYGVSGAQVTDSGRTQDRPPAQSDSGDG